MTQAVEHTSNDTCLVANRWQGALWSSENDECGTPPDFFDKLNLEFHFTLDACSSIENYKCSRYYSIDGSGIGHDGLLQDWAGEVVWCNPPYSQVSVWMKKCSEEGQSRTQQLLP